MSNRLFTSQFLSVGCLRLEAALRSLRTAVWNDSCAGRDDGTLIVLNFNH